MASSQGLQKTYDILLLGKTGYGKSTTGNKLLGINEGSMASEALWDKAEDGVTCFETGDSSTSVTTKCKLLSNDRDIRVLDTPGFGNTQLTKRFRALECNQQIFHSIMQEQEKHDLAFSRVLYFLPKRGPLEREEGTLQDEIRAMHEFWGDGIFNIMVIVATNEKRRQITGFDKEDHSTTEKVFSAAYKTMTGKRLRKCPPIRYLPLAETDVIGKIMSAEVIVDKPLKLLVGPQKMEKKFVPPLSRDKPLSPPTAEQAVPSSLPPQKGYRPGEPPNTKKAVVLQSSPLSAKVMVDKPLVGPQKIKKKFVPPLSRDKPLSPPTAEQAVPPPLPPQKGYRLGEPPSTERAVVLLSSSLKPDKPPMKGKPAVSHMPQLDKPKHAIASSQGPQRFYDILLVGKTGYGRSSTGNKLLGISEVSMASEAAITLWDKAEDGVTYFETGDGSTSVTTKCKLLSNDRDIRVLDTPGFGNTQLTKRFRALECNQQIFHSIMQEQEKHDLAFSRVLYFLPKRGPLEREEGTLQDEIRAMHEFWGDGIFNIMVIVATNEKRRQITGFDKEDHSTTEKVFSAAYKTMTGKRLRKCPPIRYLPLAETDVIGKIMSAEVIVDKPWRKKPVVKEEKPLVEPQKKDEPVELPTNSPVNRDKPPKSALEKAYSFEEQPKKEKPVVPQRPLRKAHTISETVEHPLRDGFLPDEPVKREKPVVHQKQPCGLAHNAKQNPGKGTSYRRQCRKCGGQIVYEGPQPVKVICTDKTEVSYEQSKCHPYFISPEGGILSKFAHTVGASIGLTLGQTSANFDETCPVCNCPRLTIGCTLVGDTVLDATNREVNKSKKITTEHETAQ